MIEARFSTFAMLGLLLAYSPTRAGPGSAYSDRLMLSRSMQADAKAFCETPDRFGMRRTYAGSIGGSIELPKLGRWSAPISGQAKLGYQSESYRGILQRQLAQALADTNQCRLKAYDAFSRFYDAQQAKPKPTKAIPARRSLSPHNNEARRAPPSSGGVYADGGSQIWMLGTKINTNGRGITTRDQAKVFAQEVEINGGYQKGSAAYVSVAMNPSPEGAPISAKIVGVYRDTQTRGLRVLTSLAAANGPLRVYAPHLTKGHVRGWLGTDLANGGVCQTRSDWMNFPVHGEINPESLERESVVINRTPRTFSIGFDCDRNVDVGDLISIGMEIVFRHETSEPNTVSFDAQVPVSK